MIWGDSTGSSEALLAVLMVALDHVQNLQIHAMRAKFQSTYHNVDVEIESLEVDVLHYGCVQF